MDIRKLKIGDIVWFNDFLYGKILGKIKNNKYFPLSDIEQDECNIIIENYLTKHCWLYEPSRIIKKASKKEIFVYLLENK